VKSEEGNLKNRDQLSERPASLLDRLRSIQGPGLIERPYVALATLTAFLRSAALLR